MDINATLIIQMLVFVLFIWVTMRFIWPPITKALEERRKKIADGLAAAEAGERALEEAQKKIQEELTQTKTQASHIIEQANHRAAHIVEEAKEQAIKEGERLLQLARSEIQREYFVAKEELLRQVSDLAITAAEKILQHEIDKESNDRLVAKLANEI